MVSGNTYRHPAVTAKMAAQIDVISGGRFILGLGAAWQENEHHAYGIRFGTLKERMDRFEEACHLITDMFRHRRSNFTGQYYQLVDAPMEPRPIQTPLPLMIGGGGEKRTLRIAAQYADEWNVWGTPEALIRKQSVLDAHCSDVHRDPAEIQRSACTLLMMTDNDDRLGRERASGRPVLGGSNDAIRQTVQAYVDAGVDEIIIPDFTLGSNALQRTEQMDRFIEENRPWVSSGVTDDPPGLPAETAFRWSGPSTMPGIRAAPTTTTTAAPSGRSCCEGSSASAPTSGRERAARALAVTGHVLHLNCPSHAWQWCMAGRRLGPEVTAPHRKT